MSRIRTIAATALAAAALVAGAALAGATQPDDKPGDVPPEFSNASEAAYDAVAEAFAKRPDLDESTDGGDEPAPAEVDPNDGGGNPDDNHGAYVSEIARTTEPGPNHGKVVSAAARSKWENGPGRSGDSHGRPADD